MVHHTLTKMIKIKRDEQERCTQTLISVLDVKFHTHFIQHRSCFLKFNMHIPHDSAIPLWYLLRRNGNMPPHKLRIL